MDTVKKKMEMADLIGIIFGIALGYAWIFVIVGFLFTILSTTSYTDGMAVTGYTPGPIQVWLSAGGFMFFILIGHMLVYALIRGKAVRNDATFLNDIKLMEGMAIGFMAWLLIAAYFNSLSTIDFNHISGLFLGTGYIAMIVPYALLKAQWDNIITVLITVILAAFAALNLLQYLHVW